MSHKNKVCLTVQIQERYKDMLAIGHSKHFDKQNGGTQDKIYSYGTLKAYLKHANYFADYCKEKYGCKTLEQCRPHVDEFLMRKNERTGADLSASTLKLEASALGKLYRCPITDFKQTSSRLRENITRSRGEKARDYGFSLEKNKDIIEFCRSTGLRRRELTALRGSSLEYKDGKMYVKVTIGGKGGRTRMAEVVHNKALVAELMGKAGSNRVFESVPSHMDVHSYRADYCSNVYRLYARDVSTLPREEVYCCRRDLKGIKYDKVAMLRASQNLGHNRIDVIAGHYLHSLQ